MKTFRIFTLIALVLLLTACAKTENTTLTEAAQTANQVGQMATTVNPLPAPMVQIESIARPQQVANRGETAVRLFPTAPAASELTEAEIASLRWVREEEKLTHDVYTALHEIWALPVLQNIAASELNHAQSVLRVMDLYGVDNTAAGNPPGVFNDPVLQTMYTQMVAQGSQSLLEALRAGAAIEEMDILDLQARMAQTANPDILRVYESLLNGSANHLRSFARLIEQQTGAPYQPQYLTDEAYAEMMALAGENSRNGQGAGGNGQGQGQGQGRGQGQGQGNRGSQ